MLLRDVRPQTDGDVEQEDILDRVHQGFGGVGPTHIVAHASDGGTCARCQIAQTGLRKGRSHMLPGPGAMTAGGASQRTTAKQHERFAGAE